MNRIAATLLLASAVSGCDAAPSAPDRVAASHPRTRTDRFTFHLETGTGIGHPIAVQHAGTLLARLTWDNPSSRLALWLCEQGSRGGCKDGPPLQVGAFEDGSTQALATGVRSAAYLVMVENPRGSSQTTYVLTVTYPLLPGSAGLPQ